MCEEESTGRSKKSSSTKPKVVSKQLSNSMFGIETIPKSILGKAFDWNISRCTQRCARLWSKQTLQRRERQVGLESVKGTKSNASNGQSDNANDSSFGENGLKEVP